MKSGLSPDFFTSKDFMATIQVNHLNPDTPFSSKLRAKLSEIKALTFLASLFCILCLVNGTKAQPATLWGLAGGGGDYTLGTIMSIKADGSNFSTEYSFPKIPGSSPSYTQMISYNGKHYGLTAGGGNYDLGVLFEFDPNTGDYAALHHFDGISGANPYGSLLENGGKFYGMTGFGGIPGLGVIFEFDPAGSGSYQVLHEFDGTDGANPYGSLLLSGGKYYGLTSNGGSSDVGVMFYYDPSGSGSYQVLHEFGGTDGANPNGSLMESGGKFYGMTQVGGTNDMGLLFE